MLVRLLWDEPVGTLVLDHPERRNALSRALVEEFLEGLEELRRREARGVVVQSAGGPVWSAGHDIGELPQGQEPLGYSDALERLIRGVRRFPAPVVAKVHGSVWGGATDLVLNCDLVVGDETCSFAVTPANLGLPYNTLGLLHFLRRLPLNLVKELFFTAAPLKAPEALRWGFLNRLVSAEDLDREVEELLRTMASKAPLVLSSVKEQLRILGEADPVTPEVFERMQDLRRRVFESEDYREGIRAFREKRPPRFRGR